MRKILIRNIDINRWKKVGNRVLVYGRRKVGKSFFVRNFTEWDEYFFVKRDGGILDTKTSIEINYSYLKDFLLRERKKVIIDEFQRLPEDFLDFLQAFNERLNLVLITSTLWLSKKILGEGSPILGLFEEFKLELVDERDILKFSKKLKGKELIDTCIYIREPWLIPLLKGSIYNEIPRILIEEKNTIERLIGEIFREEGRELKKSYTTILSAISSGKMKSSEISSLLFSRKIIPKDDPSIIQGHLKILCNIGILEKLKILNKKFDYFMQKSPLLDLYFYLDSKYGFSEIEIPEKEIKKVFMEKLPFHVEQFFRILLSKIFSLKAGKIIEKDFDIDIALYSFKKIEVLCEVKWKNFISKEEIEKIERNLEKYEKVKKILIVPDEKNLEVKPRKLEVWDSKTILKKSIKF